MSGRYALTRVNGHEEQFVVYEELQGSDTYQLLIAFDTLEFLGDGLFFRQHRSDGTLRRDARGDIVAISMNEWTTAGSYVRDDAGVILRAHGAAAADTLVPIAGETTFRQSWQILDTTVEAEYTRVP